MKTSVNMVTTPERVVTNAVRERKLAYVRGQGLVEGNALVDKRAPAGELARVELAKRARLMRANPEALALRQALVEIPEATYDVVPGTQKVRKYKGKTIARSFRY